jgi:anti-anti-sigma factor
MSCGDGWKAWIEAVLMIVDPGRLEERKRRLRLPGRREVELAGVPQARAAAEWAGRQPAGPPLVLDVSRVSFIDSTGVRMLLETKDEARRPVGLLSPSGAVLRVLDLTGLRGRFVELEDLEESTVRKLAVSPG